MSFCFVGLKILIVECGTFGRKHPASLACADGPQRWGDSRARDR